MAFRFWMPAFAGMSGREIVPAFSQKGEDAAIRAASAASVTSDHPASKIFGLQRYPDTGMAVSR
jgi:hypothetical protein